MISKQRDRGRILTPDGLSRLQQAIRAWELEHEVRCTQERIKELTSAVKESGLDPGTIRKILKAKEGVDPESIRYLFTTFGLQLHETDLASSSRLQVQADPNFVGREGAIADLNALVNRGAKVIVIQARGGVGKTTLARKYLQQEFGSFLEFPIAKETKDIASIESLIEEKLRQLGEEPGREFFVSLDRLKRKLQVERIGILIDNLEPALDAAGKLIEPHRRYVELLRVLADPSVQAVTLTTSRERLNEYSISVQHYLLEELSLEAWKQFFRHRFALFAGDRDVSEADYAALVSLHKAYGGNAKAMDILCGTILTDYSSSIEAYWQANQDDLLIERALEDLVVGQFDRLQQLDPDAYNLLCRMGCYRYQDVPTVPIEGLLCLLWDVPENRQRRVVKSLQEQSLVECEGGEYWLHPVIRAEAIGRLRETEDRDAANRKAAEFWTERVIMLEKVRDALEAFEAYYHCVETCDFENAAEALVMKRWQSKWSDFDEGETLSGGGSRLGLLRQISFALIQLISKVQSEFLLCTLYSSLGSIYRQRGYMHEAIDYSQKGIELAKKYIKNAHRDADSKEIGRISRIRWIEASSLTNIGNCKIDLWELEGAVEYFEKAIQTNINYIKPISNFRLALVYSFLGDQEKVTQFTNQVINELSTFKLNAWARGYRFLSLGSVFKYLENFDKAFDMYNRAISYATESHYIQVKAVALCGLAELYRRQNNFLVALSNNLESIHLLNRTGARCELAEAYYQIGLTYQAMNEIEKGNENFQVAIQLFTEMEAPKQVERVRRSMLTDSSK